MKIDDLAVRMKNVFSYLKLLKKENRRLKSRLDNNIKFDDNMIVRFKNLEVGKVFKQATYGKCRFLVKYNSECAYLIKNSRISFEDKVYIPDYYKVQPVDLVLSG